MKEVGRRNKRCFLCVDIGCKATLATLGDLSGDLTLKFHFNHLHNHRADVPANIVSATLHEFRGEMDINPDRPAKKLFEDITTKAMEAAIATPDKLALATKLPTSRTGIS